MASAPKPAREKIRPLAALAAISRQAKSRKKRVVFTNGCFDVVHAGHVTILEKARRLGDILIVGVNSDKSVRAQNKAPDRPIIGGHDRALLLAALASVDYVVLFNEPTPLRVIEALKPDVLVKGADWETGDIVGRDAVERNGGKVVRVALVPGLSTTQLVERIRAGKSALDD